MASAKYFLILLSLCLSSTALAASSHVNKSPHAHHAIAARSPVLPVDPIVKRAPKRCKPRAQAIASENEKNLTAPKAPPKEEPKKEEPKKEEPKKEVPKKEEPKKEEPKKEEPKKEEPKEQPASGGETFTGDATYYATGLGACGKVNNDNDFIAAASAKLFDGFEGSGPNPNNNRICGRKLIASYQGKSVTVTITDKCPPCERGSLDFSPAAFKELAPLEKGRLKGLEWKFIN